MKHRHSATEDPVKIVGIVSLAAFIGATVAMLFTPRSGQQVRRGIKRRANTAKESMQDHFVQNIDDAEDVTAEARDRLQSTADKVANDTKATTRKVAKDAKAATNQTKTTVKRAAKSEDKS